MKKAFFVFCIVLFVMPGFSQFQVSHGTNNNEVGRSIRTVTADKAYIIGGFTDNPFISKVDATLLKTRYDGSIIWSRVYGLTDYESFNSVRPILPNADKGYVCLGTTNSIGFGKNDMLYIRTDKDGAPINAYVYGRKNRDVGHCIQVVKDFEIDEPVIIMIGETYSYSRTSKMYIIKTRLDGTFLDGAIVGNNGNQKGFWIEQTPDGGFIAVGSSDFACGTQPNLSNPDIFVVKLKPSLDLEWARTIGGGPELPYKDVAYSVKNIREGYLITGHTQSFGEGNTNDAFLLKLSHNGGFIWLRNYGHKQNDGAYDVSADQLSVVNQAYILNGFTTVKNNTFALLLATDINGNIMWKRGYGWYGHQIGYEMDRALKPGFVFTGMENSFGLNMRGIYQVVTDVYGKSNCPECEFRVPIKSKKHKVCIQKEGFSRPIETGMEIDVKNIKVEYVTLPCGTNEKSAEGESLANNDNPELLIYPNPTNREFNIDYPDRFNSGNLELYNSLGQLVSSKVLPETNSTPVYLENTHAGLYLVVISNKQGEKISSKLLIR